MTNATSNQQLEPCRFCGGESMIEEFRDGDDPQPLFVATCKICPVKTYDQFTPEEAARIWNSRVSASGVVATDAVRSCETYAEMIESQNDLSGQTENWADFHRGQHYAAKQLAESFRAATASPAAPKEEACSCCAHPTGFLPAVPQNGNWLHHGRDSVEVCTATPRQCEYCKLEKTSPECWNCGQFDPAPAAQTPSPDVAREAAEAIITYLQPYDLKWGVEDLSNEVAEIIRKHCFPTGGESGSAERNTKQ